MPVQIPCQDVDQMGFHSRLEPVLTDPMPVQTPGTRTRHGPPMQVPGLDMDRIASFDAPIVFRRIFERIATPISRYLPTAPVQSPYYRHGVCPYKIPSILLIQGICGSNLPIPSQGICGTRVASSRIASRGVADRILRQVLKAYYLPTHVSGAVRESGLVLITAGAAEAVVELPEVQYAPTRTMLSFLALKRRSWIAMPVLKR
eukprot:103209-Rhodomonas_salina.1